MRVTVNGGFGKSMCLAAAFCGVFCCAFLVADEKPPKKEATAAKDDSSRNRLPDHYADVVDDAQREKIYKIQDSFAPKIEELKLRLAAARDEMKTAIRAVLTPEQQKKVDSLAGNEKPKRKKKSTK